MSKEKYDLWRNLHDVEGKLAYSLAVFGDALAEREGYREVSGIEAVHFYVMHKFRWLPSVVRSMSADDLQFVLKEDMSGWTMPPDAR